MSGASPFIGRIGRARAVLLSLAIAGAPGCRACAGEPQAGTADADPALTVLTPPPAAVDASAEDTRTDLVRHDCGGLEPRVDGCAGSRGPGDLLMRFSEKLTEMAALHTRPPATFWDAGRTALAEAAGIDVASLAYGERVHVQNAALNLALSADAGKESALARSAVGVVRKLAFEAAGRRPADPPLQVETWLGPSSTWSERSKTTPMFHESVFRQTRLLRIVRTPVLHANFTQLLAVGVDGRPFLTPVVGSIEIRRGEEHTSPACVAITSPERVRCNVAAGLAGVREVEELPKNHFFRGAREGRLPCNGCHTAVAESDGMLLGITSVDAGTAAAELTRREALLVETVGRALEKLWR